jgi:hypothetical protein
MTHLTAQHPHASGFQTFNYTLRTGRRNVRGAFFAPDAEAAMKYARETIAADYVWVSSITVALA